MTSTGAKCLWSPTRAALRLFAAIACIATLGCTSSTSTGSSAADGNTAGHDVAGGASSAGGDDSSTTGGVAGGAQVASVVGVTTSGAASSYTFLVTIESPDVGCSAYADWWEVATPDGELVYRRILAHSHADEQPFTRSGGPVDVAETDSLVVRAHFNPGGYGGAAMAGSVANGFKTDATFDENFAPALADAAPQPSDCAF